ncbi:atherin-like [Suricata suricatta]|uniref:atherin-like n=1 Tax=Suricata suricatta TaxID=37032 RepID=UPI001155961A|nr:atherin-like [Suricata suricatta]
MQQPIVSPPQQATEQQLGPRNPSTGRMCSSPLEARRTPGPAPPARPPLRSADAARAAATAGAARGRRRRAGGRGLRGRFPRPGRPRLAQRPQRKRGGQRVRAIPGCDRDGGLLSRRRWPASRAAPRPLSGFAVPRGVQLTSPPPQLPLRPRQAESGGGSSSPHRLIPALPKGNAARPARVTSGGSWGPSGRARRTREPHSGADRAGHRCRRPFSGRPQRPGAAAELRAPAVASRPAPSARRSLSRVSGEAPHGACAPRSRRRRRPVAELQRREGQAVEVCLCCGLAGSLFQIDSPTYCV